MCLTLSIESGGSVFFLCNIFLIVCFWPPWVFPTFLVVGRILVWDWRTLQLARIQTLLSLWNLPSRSLELSFLVRKLVIDPWWVFSCFRNTWRSILFLTVGFMGLWFIVPLSVQEKMGLLVGRDHLVFSLCLPSSAHLSASSFSGSPRWALILMKMVSSPWHQCF